MITLPVDGADVHDSPTGAAIARLRGGLALPFDRVDGDWIRVETPCSNTRWLRWNGATFRERATVVIDPGHGGDERGAKGPSGQEEAVLNLAVANEAMTALQNDGIDTVLTRTQDVRATLQFRIDLAASLSPAVVVSIHHNAEPDGPRTEGPGTETYYQVQSSASKRLSGLLYEDVADSLAAFQADWAGDTDAGAKFRLNSRGSDYYGILKRSNAAGLVTSLAELAFITNPTEDALLQRDDVRRAEGRAVARAITRYLRTDDPGSGFTTPYPRTTPAGPGGGPNGCIDPTP